MFQKSIRLSGLEERTELPTNITERIDMESEEGEWNIFLVW